MKMMTNKIFPNINEECKNRKRIVITTGVKCPKEGCEGEIVQRKSKYGKIFVNI